MQKRHERGPEPRASRFSALANEPRFLMLLPGLFWAGNAIVARGVAEEIPPIALAFWRWTVAAALIAPLAWPHLRRDMPTLARRWPTMVLLSALGISVFNTFLYIGAHTTTAINIVMLQTAIPIIVVLATFLIFRETLTGGQAAGIAASFVGTLILITHGDPAILSNLDFKRGDLWLLAAVVSYAVYTALLRLRPPVHGLSFVFVTFVIGALLLLPFYIAETLTSRPLPITPHAALAIGYVAVFASILSYLAYNRVVALLGANTAGLTAHLVPVFGIILAVLLLGERLYAYHGVGIALIALGLWLATRGSRA
ncbi:DMT family transporter [Hyphomicrobium sp. CS1GBMeth3]|uniref:DMT family transporter n=1 Tax=Hyphomicrobium sp. CS1GBMeth3 TaxID=1892845 RepID=UPI000931D208|nr:DMT family transporter [Hyphomicrobium sp. CS1GBMeth3]